MHAITCNAVVRLLEYADAGMVRMPGCVHVCPPCRYITTKLANPHYTPEISTKVCDMNRGQMTMHHSANAPDQHELGFIGAWWHVRSRARVCACMCMCMCVTQVMIVNFTVKEQGLEAQLLNAVVKAERPDLDKQKNDLVVKVAAGKRTQVRPLPFLDAVQPCKARLPGMLLCRRPTVYHGHVDTSYAIQPQASRGRYACVHVSACMHVFYVDMCACLQAELEDTILALLSAAEGSLLDNTQLINTLDASKTTWEEVNQSLKVRT